VVAQAVTAQLVAASFDLERSLDGPVLLEVAAGELLLGIADPRGLPATPGPAAPRLAPPAGREPAPVQLELDGHVGVLLEGHRWLGHLERVAQEADVAGIGHAVVFPGLHDLEAQPAGVVRVVVRDPGPLELEAGRPVRLVEADGHLGVLLVGSVPDPHPAADRPLAVEEVVVGALVEVPDVLHRVHEVVVLEQHDLDRSLRFAHGVSPLERPSRARLRPARGGPTRFPRERITRRLERRGLGCGPGGERMGDVIQYAVDEGIATITMNRPEKRNAMTFAMLDAFLDAVRRAGEDGAARAVIVTGAGGAFCAGTDLSDLAGRPSGQRARGGRDEGGRWWPLVECPKPVIGAIDGPAVGMGAEFTSQCDVRIASSRARFAWNFAHRGLVPDTGSGTWLLPRILGHAQALRLLYSGEFLDAELAALASTDEGPGVRGPGTRPRRPPAGPRRGAPPLLRIAGPPRGGRLLPRATPRPVHGTLRSG
jgi:hypothetical protein